jgi:hypothetical protein
MPVIVLLRCGECLKEVIPTREGQPQLGLFRFLEKNFQDAG